MRRFCLACVSALLLLLGLAGAADARPGGGQNFHAPAPSYHPTPSYHPSYGSGSTYYVPTGGGSGGAPSTLAIVSLVAVILVVSLIYNSFIKARRSPVAVQQAVRDLGLGALRAHDPGFDPAQFAARAAATMARVNEAWIAGAMGPARRFISDGVYTRFQTQLGLLRAAGLRNAMADWRVVGAQVAAAESDPLWDTVHVRMIGEARDADLPLAIAPDEAARRLAHAPLQRYEEVWSFVRRRGQRDKGAPMLQGKCPSCGAALPPSESVRCDYCKALVNSGEHDWVLAEITQPEVWRPSAALQQTAGLEQVRARDPSLSRQELEDRASVVFWKWIEARVTGSRARLDRFCVAPGRPPAPPAALQQVAVGGADLAVVSATPDGFDRAHVDVTWSATAGTFVDRVVLVRSSQVRSKRGLSSLDCPNCNGPLAESDAIRCDYCGAPLGGGQHEWSLEAIAERRA